METSRLVLVLVTALLTASCSPLISGSAIGLSGGGGGGGGEFLTITPSRTQIKAVGTKLIFTCTLVHQQSTDDTPVTSVTLQRPLMQWKGPDSNYVTNQKGRVYAERLDEKRLRLYITEVEERDSGSYSCEANVNGALLVAHSHLNLFDDIRFLNGTPSHVQQRIGTSVLLECSAFGKPEPEISWRFRGRKLTSERQSEKYVYEKRGLRINHLTKDDNGTYECRAQVPSQGNLKVRHVSLEVLYPPEWIVPPSSPLAIRGNDVTLECLAEGNPPVKYQWFKEVLTSNGAEEEPLRNDVDDDDDDSEEDDEDDIDHYGTATFSIERVEMTDQGRYICRTSNGLGSIDAFYDINVLVIPVVTVPKHPSVLEGKTIELPCEAVGIPAPIVTWKRRNEDLDVVGGDDDTSVNMSEGGIVHLSIRNADRKRHSGKYTCSANNSAGFDSKDVDVIVETLPEAWLSDTELVGWRGMSRQVTCLATGLPLPTIVWLHDGKVVSSSNHHVHVTTIRDAENVTSILEIKLEEDVDYFFGNYSCVAKNIHDHVSREFQLRRAYPPEAPRNVTVVEETSNSISLSAYASSPGPGTPFLPPTKWILKYQKTLNSIKPEMTINLLYEEGSSIVVGNLDTDTAYTMYLSAANAAGIGPSVKFQAKTASRDVAPKYPVTDDESGDFQGDDGGRAVDASLQREAVALEKDLLLERTLLSDWGGISIGLVIGIAVMLAVVVVTVSGAIVRTQRAVTARRAVMTVVKEGGAASTTIKVSECKDIDSLKVETNRPKTTVGPIPGDRYGSLGSRKNVRIREGSVGVGASPVMARAGGCVSPGVVRAAAGVGAVDGGSNSAQSQAWQSMLLKAEADARDEALLKELEAQGAVDELPHPPLEMLHNEEVDEETRDAEVGEEAEEAEEEEEDVTGDDDISRTKEEGELSEDSMSLNSDDESGFPKAPQFEGKSFRQF